MTLHVKINISNLIICEHCGCVFCGDMINCFRDDSGKLLWECKLCKKHSDADGG